ncbi:MAG: hypothetical protein LUE92_06730 [Clostridiales bacterium]|nr:hypothetical protein [Clostridiales bacterium]
MKVKKLTAVFLAGTMAFSLFLGGCGNKIDQDAVAATIGEQEISLGYLNFVARYTQSSYDSFFVSYYGEDYWTNEDYADEDGLNMQESVKADVLSDVELEYLLEAHMDDYGVEITDEEMEAITAAAEEFMSENTEDALDAMGATQEYVESYLYYETVYAKMEEAIGADADSQLSIDDYARRTFSYIEIDTVGYTDDDGEYVEYTEDEAEALLSNIELIAVLASSDFESAAETYGYDVSTYSYGTDEASEEDGGFCDAVITAADAMSEGDVSEAIEGTDYYYIIRLDSEDDADAQQDAYDEAVSELQSEIFTEVTEGYQDESDFEVDEDLWAQVQFTELFTIDNTEEETDTDVSE